MSVPASLAERARGSAWVTACAGLADAVAAWEHDLGRGDAGPTEERLAAPGLVSPSDAARRWTALSTAQVGWLTQRLPGDVLARRPLGHPGEWLQEATTYVLRDQLAGLGPAAAEVAAILAEAEGVVPRPLVDELRRRPVTVSPMGPRKVDRLARRALPGRLGPIGEPLSVSTTSQLHPAELRDGTTVLLRVCRPDVADDARSDARLAADVLAPLQWAVPALRAVHPLALVEVVSRQLVDGADARHEALNAVHVGMLVEDLALAGAVVCRPLPELVAPGAAAFEAPPGAAAFSAATPPAAPGASPLDAFVGLTLDAALSVGEFHADLRPEHLLSLPDGRVALAGCRRVGRLDAGTRRATVELVATVLTGDTAGQAAALVALGVVPPDADVAALAAALAVVEPDSPLVLLSAPGERRRAVLGQAGAVLRRHHARVPPQLMEWLRALLALRSLAGPAAAHPGLIRALAPVVMRLPQLRVSLA